MVDLCQPFLAFNGETGKQLGSKWVKTVSPVTVLQAQFGPSVDIKTESPICLSSAGSRPTIHWTVAVAHPHLMTFVISFPLQTVSSSSLAVEEAKSREQSLPFTLGYWLSVCSNVAGMLCSDSVSGGFFFPSLLWLALRKLGCQKVKLAVWFKMFRFCLLVTLSPCHKDFYLHILALNIRVSASHSAMHTFFFYIYMS